jgi:hypothetical protein
MIRIDWGNLSMKKHYTFCRLVITVLFIFAATNMIAQNVGINKTNPNESLDVNGNINVSGTIKANGTDGTANQILMKDNAGTMIWGDMCEYKNVAVLSNSSGTWTVPAGVTKIFTEVWGAGGGGNGYGGGAGGGYIAATYTVTPGTVTSYTCGTGGSGAGFSNATSGGPSSFTTSTGAFSISGFGGGGATFVSAGIGTCGSPAGGLGLGASVVNYVYELGKAGEPVSKNYMQYNATTFYETGSAGKGGPPGHSNDTGATGGYYVFNTTANTLVLRVSKAATGVFPGGGGASGYDYPLLSVSGGNGGNGLVIIHW